MHHDVFASNNPFFVLYSLFASDGNEICICLECGFHCSDNDPVPCSKRNENKHTGPCEECVQSFELFQYLREFHSEVDDMLKETYSFDHLLKDDMEQWKEDIEQFFRNFMIYRSHLAQAKDESIWDGLFYRNLGPNECIVVMDFKMKILAALFREKQKDWFSKRGFSLLGALIIFGSEKEEDHNEVLYHFFISDDTTQDAEYVNIVKEVLYKHVLPKYGIDSVHYRCDGAGCFVSAEAKSAMTRWFDLCGVTEKTYKNNVPGKGKSPLDGQFGVLGQSLTRQVDEGGAFSTAEELYELLLERPLQYTEYYLLDLKRDLVNWKVTKEIEKLPLSRGFYLLKNENGKVTGYPHSRHGAGKRLSLLDEGE